MVRQLNHQKMIFVQGGIFEMGQPDPDIGGAGWTDNEQPVHGVKVNDFYIGKYPVTQKLYQKIMDNNPSDFSGSSHPVESVSWYDAIEFCNKLSHANKLEPCYKNRGKMIECDFSAGGYRLPTEAEWEYAALGGKLSQGYKFSGSNNIDEVAWYDKNANENYWKCPHADREGTQPVGLKKPNELGLHGMSGNIWEWCWDWHDRKYYAKSPNNNPTGPARGTSRILRGGFWFGGACNCRAKFRSLSDPNYSSSIIGFRIIRAK